jgi:DNA-directed RNA polymerase subunit K/omega
MDVSREITKLVRLTEKVGGRFKLSVLMQKRLKQLQRRELGIYAPDLKKLMSEVCNEIDSGKIELVTEEVYRESLRGALARSEELQKK